MNYILHIKNMVCNRCIKVVRDELSTNQIDFARVGLGTVHFNGPVDEVTKDSIGQILKKEGFELLKDRDSQLINRVKSLLIEQIHHGDRKAGENISTFLADRLNVDYSILSKLFSQYEGKTIEKYIVHQKIEKVKELIKYGELNLSQISYELDYSSPQHLSRQFKQVTGLTPTQFKAFGERNKIDKI